MIYKVQSPSIASIIPEIESKNYKYTQSERELGHLPQDKEKTRHLLFANISDRRHLTKRNIQHQLFKQMNLNIHLIE